MLTQDELINAVADILRQMRRERGFTLEKLSERAEMDYSTVSLIENGRQNPRIYTAYKLLYALDIDIIRLLTAKSKTLEDKKASILNRLEQLDLNALENLDDFLKKFTLSKK